MPIDQPPAIVITIVKDGLRFDVKGEQPVWLGDGNIMFPSHWTNEQGEKWLDENTTPETRPGPRRF